ncbi:CPBP family intramembrane metalloprotease (plasmid) [Citrobacter braakii]
MAFFFILITQVLIATLFYLFYLKKFTECEIRIKTDVATVKFSILSFLTIILIQLAVYCYRDYLYHYEPYHLNWIAILVAILLVPYYEEIIYRACVFGFFCSVYRKNIIIPCVITSLFFSLMHFQYYNILDQSVLFVVSMLLLVVRIQSKSLFYSMLIHSGMNAFVILLNTQKMI